MTPSEAKKSLKDLHGDLFSLNPSALIVLYEIDVSGLLLDKGFPYVESDAFFRFHNTNTYKGSIWWRGKEYIAAPINAEGFDVNSKGTLPIPKLSLSSNEEGIPLLSTLKRRINQLGDLVGSKVVRRRTLARFLDDINFDGNVNPYGQDANAQFPEDVYYIDRKSTETKNIIEYELASLLDVEGVKLPGRLVLANRCPFQYRGEGCLYEFQSRRVESIHGQENESTLPVKAPPVASESDELIVNQLPFGIVLNDKGLWVYGTSYSIGDYVYIEKDGIKYYFVAKLAMAQNQIYPPPNSLYWISDFCSKALSGCKLRWGLDVNNNPSPGRHPNIGGNPHGGNLPFGGFPSVNKVS